MLKTINAPTVTQPAHDIRVKVTNRCPWSCWWCHREGSCINQDLLLSTCLTNFLSRMRRELGTNALHLTGGEPTSLPMLPEHVRTYTEMGFDVSLTSNGFNPTLWPALRDAGLKKTNFSIHTLSDVEFARFHRTPHTIVWARQSLQNTIDSVLIAKELGMTVKVNTTIVRPTSQWRPIFEFCKNTGIPWRAQNELDSPTAVAAIGEIIASVGGQLVQIIRKTPTSRISYEYKDTDGYHFSVKLITPASLHHLCSECKVQANCTEGFYTLRLEPNASGDSFNIRLCLHRTDAGSVFSPDAFVRSEVFKELSKKYQRNFAYSTSN